MAKKVLIVIIVAAVVGLGLAGAGIYFMMNKYNPEAVAEEEKRAETFDSKDGQRLALEKVQVFLPQASSQSSYILADFSIIFKDEKALANATNMQADIKDAILGVFETETKGKTVEEIKSMRNDFKEPILNAIKALYNEEEDKEKVYKVLIPTFIVK